MSTTTEKAWTYVETFRTLAQSNPGPIEDSIAFDFGKHDLHCVLTSVVHGNEVGSLPGICQLVEDIQTGKISFGGRLSILLGNVAACKEGKRFLESDLNRAFSDTPPDTAEGRRATQMKSILHSANLHVDFHQTILASDKPFWIFPYHQAGLQWAQYMDVATDLVTRSPNKVFSADGRCCDEYVRLQGNPAITLEMGQAELTPEAQEWTYRASTRALAGLDALATQSATLEELASQGASLECHEIVFQQKFEKPEMRLRDGLVNFIPIVQGEVMGVNHDGGELISPINGRLLFPNFPKRDENGVALKHPKELYCLIQALKEAPEILYASN